MDLKKGMIVKTCGGIQLRRGLYAKLISDVINQRVDILFAPRYRFDNYSQMNYCVDDLECLKRMSQEEFASVQDMFKSQDELQITEKNLNRCEFCDAEVSVTKRLQIRFQSGDVLSCMLCDSCLENKSLEIETISIVYLSV